MNNKLNLHHIELAKTGLGVSGGEICLLELVKNLNDKFNQIIYTTENGKIAYKRNKANVKYVVVSPFWIEKVFGVYISFLLRILVSFSKIQKFKRNFTYTPSFIIFLEDKEYSLRTENGGYTIFVKARK